MFKSLFKDTHTQNYLTSKLCFLPNNSRTFSQMLSGKKEEKEKGKQDLY